MDIVATQIQASCSHLFAVFSSQLVAKLTGCLPKQHFYSLVSGLNLQPSIMAAAEIVVKLNTQICVREHECSIIFMTLSTTLKLIGTNVG